MNSMNKNLANIVGMNRFNITHKIKKTNKEFLKLAKALQKTQKNKLKEQVRKQKTELRKLRDDKKQLLSNILSFFFESSDNYYREKNNGEKFRLSLL